MIKVIIFKGSDKFAYRDPACYIHHGVCHLFFTISEKDNGYMYNRIAHSQSADLKSWSAPEFITVKDKRLNFSSPGNIIQYNNEYIMCCCSYPMPEPFSKCAIADDTARLFTITTRDFITFSEPQPLNPKSKVSVSASGRMIDPYILKKDDFFYLFFKQNGISLSRSADLLNWDFLGSTDGGENACVIEYGTEYLLIHSPQNGIAISRSKDLHSWKYYSETTLLQSKWDWAKGRLTAAFAAELPSHSKYKYVLFFHGSRNIYPETHGNATLAMAFTNDFKHFAYEI